MLAFPPLIFWEATHLRCMDKHQVAEILTDIGTLLELQGENRFKTRAYVNGAWATEEDLGNNIVGGPGSAAWAANRLDACVRGSDNGLWWINWNGGAWSGWVKIPGSTVLSDPAVSSRGSGMLDVFYKGANGNMKQMTYSNGAWSPSEFDLGGPIGAL